MTRRDATLFGRAAAAMLRSDVPLRSRSRPESVAPAAFSILPELVGTKPSSKSLTRAASFAEASDDAFGDLVTAVREDSLQRPWDGRFHRQSLEIPLASRGLRRLDRLEQLAAVLPESLAPTAQRAPAPGDAHRRRAELAPSGAGGDPQAPRGRGVIASPRG